MNGHNVIFEEISLVKLNVESFDEHSTSHIEGKPITYSQCK